MPVTRVVVFDRGAAAMRLLDAVVEASRADGIAMRTVVAPRGCEPRARWARDADEIVVVACDATVDDVLDATRPDVVWAAWGLDIDTRLALAEACEQRGIRHIGARAHVLRQLASDERMSELAARAGLPRLAPAAAADHGTELVTVDVAADGNGAVWVTGIREHSVPGVEEAPPATSDPGQEARARGAAVRLVHALGLVGIAAVDLAYTPDEHGLALVTVEPWLTPGHAVTELVTGIDLAKVQVHLADGHTLDGDAPEPLGHAVQVHLSAGETTRVVSLHAPHGTGLRVDTGIDEGDDVDVGDGALVSLAAWGRDRREALSRLGRAVAGTTVLVDPGAIDKGSLLPLLRHPDMVDGHVDAGWYATALARGELTPSVQPEVALVWAGIEAYEHDHAEEVASFHRWARRGRPRARSDGGHDVELSLEGRRYGLSVHRLHARTYRVGAAGAFADVVADRFGPYEGRLAWRGGHAHVASVVHGPHHLVEIDGVIHRVVREGGGVVRAPAPGVVVAVRVSPGDVVERGAPVAVVESMKMEQAIAAPYAGRVRRVAVIPNAQVDVGAPLVELEAIDHAAVDDGEPLDLLPVGAGSGDPTEGCTCAFETLRRWALGYDLDRLHVDGVLADLATLCTSCAPGSETLIRNEDALIDLFTALTELSSTEPEPWEPARSPQEQLFTYLRSPARVAAHAGDAFLQRLDAVLAAFGVASADGDDATREALFWLHRALLRLPAVAPAVVAILDRRLVHGEFAGAGVAARLRLDQLVGASDGRYPVIADLAREVRYQWFERAALDAARAAAYAEMDEHLAALVADPSSRDRADRLAALVACPHPMRPRLLAWYRAAESSAARAVVLDTALRRYYRTRPLGGVSVVPDGSLPHATADFELHDRPFHVVLAYAPLGDLADVVRTLRPQLALLADDTRVVVDLHMWDDAAPTDGDECAARVKDLLSRERFGRPVHRIDVTVSAARTMHVCFRDGDGELHEDELYRDLHPMLAKRLELGTLANFRIRRLPTDEEDVYLFHGVAHTNPKDERLFVIAEVRDLTPTRDDSGAIVRFPWLERLGMHALAAIRHEQAHRPPSRRLLENRVIVHVRPPADVPMEVWRAVADRLAPSVRGLGIEKVVVRLHQPEDAVLEVVNPTGGGAVVRRRPGGLHLLEPLSPYRQRVLQTQRRGAIYPYELLRLLTPAGDVDSQFPPGEFVEHDLGPGGDLVAVERPPGENVANVVVGVIRNVTPKYPDGMTRVVLLGDPSRALGALAEPECRRIIAALDLAEAMHVPLEWFALSAGALISMGSGTENMDWIAAVLRRIIEFTQAGGEINVVVTGINVGAQPYWNAEATMLMHTRGILVMTPESAMVLTGKQALDHSGGVSADDNFGIGGFERVMGPNGQGQYRAPDLEAACRVLLAHYDHTYVVPGERFPRRAVTTDPFDRDVRPFPHAPVDGSDFTTVGDVFSADRNPDRKKPFDIRSVMRAATDRDHAPLERWGRMRLAETAVVWDAHIGGIPVCLIGIESRVLPRDDDVPADGPDAYTSGTLFPQSSKKIARAVNAASGNRPLVVLANLSGFDGSPESMRFLQLEYGAEIGRAVVNFAGPIVFCVISRYHGGAFVVFSKRLNDDLEIAAIEGSYASVIGGAPAAAVVFAREVDNRTAADPRLEDLRGAERDAMWRTVRSEKLGEVADEFDSIHTIGRAQEVGSVDRIIPAADLRPYLVDALERGVRRELDRVAGTVSAAR